LPNKVSIGCDISCGTQAAANAVKAICAHLGSGSKSDYIAYSVECRLTQVAGDLAFAKRIRGAKSKLCLYFKDGQELSRQAPEQTVGLHKEMEKQ